VDNHSRREVDHSAPTNAELSVPAALHPPRGVFMEIGYEGTFTFYL
jgi:hypothetical protein